MEKEFLYFFIHKKYVISKLEGIKESDRTFNITLFDLANNPNLLNLLNLFYISGSYGVTYNYESRAKWFCGYLSAFTQNCTIREEGLKNPVVRIVVVDEELLNKIKELSI